MSPEDAPDPLGPLRWPRLWTALGWLLLAAIAVGSLLPMPQSLEVPVPGADKFQHLLGYFLLTFWHAQLGLSTPAFLLRGLGFIVLGALIEVLQAQTGYREGDLRDLAANGVGVVFGLVIGSAHPGWLTRTEARIEQLALRRGWIAQRVAAEPARD